MRSGDGRTHVDVLAVTVRGEFHDAVRERKECVVLAQADVLARIELGAALTDQNVARENLLTTEALHTEALRVRVAAVTRGTGALFRREKLKIETEHSRKNISD